MGGEGGRRSPRHGQGHLPAAEPGPPRPRGSVSPPALTHTYRHALARALRPLLQPGSDEWLLTRAGGPEPGYRQDIDGGEIILNPALMAPLKQREGCCLAIGIFLAPVLMCNLYATAMDSSQSFQAGICHGTITGHLFDRAFCKRT